MHISFLAPGIDLHDGFDDDTLEGIELTGFNSIASHLQGIWGGGIFTKMPQDDAAYGYSFQSFAPEFGTSGKRLVEFEGNYDTDGNPINAAPSFVQGQGYDSLYETRHTHQWNPAYGVTGFNAATANFVQRLKTPGQQFKFKSDTTDTVYTILSVAAAGSAFGGAKPYKKSKKKACIQPHVMENRLVI